MNGYLFAPPSKNCSSLNNIVAGIIRLMKRLSGSIVTSIGGGSSAFYHGRCDKISAFKLVAPGMCLSV
jgi:hypothetical protein